MLLLVGRRVLGDSRVVSLRHGVLSNRRVAASDHAGVAFEELVGLVCVECQWECSGINVPQL
jgi:hypothetical protein